MKTLTRNENTEYHGGGFEVNRDKSRKDDMTVVTVVFTNVRHVPLKELIEAARLQGQTEVEPMDKCPIVS